MKKFLIGAASLVMVVGLVGCNHVREIGRVGDTEYTAVRTTDVSGPNALLIIATDADGNQTVAGSFGTGGILPAAITAGGQVGAAEAFDAGDQNVNASNSSTTQIKVNTARRGPIQPSPARP